MKKRILCYGDSNTHGYTPDGGRYGDAQRWPVIMRQALGADVTVIEEGLNGRTLVHDDPTEGGYKSGLSYLPPCLMSHAPLDLLCVMLGTNDTKQRFNNTAYNIAQGLEALICLARRYADCPILVISPPHIGENLMDTAMGPIFGPGAIALSRALAGEFARVARENGCHYLNAALLCPPCAQDAVHLTEESQRALGLGAAQKAREILY